MTHLRKLPDLLLRTDIVLRAISPHGKPTLPTLVDLNVEVFH